MRFWLLVLIAVVMGTPAAAAPADEGQNQPANPTPDFMFGRPSGSIGLHGSWIVGRAGSDWYDFVTDQLTLNKGDFNRPAIGTEGAVTRSPRLDLDFGDDYGQSTTISEYG